MANTYFPNGIETTDLVITGTTNSGTLTVTGAATVSKITSAFVNNVISVDCTDNVTLNTAQKLAGVIIISASGTSKTLILGMDVGRIVVIKNAGSNSVTVKNVTGDTGVTATTVKTAVFLTTSGEPLKITADV